ncbi:MAG: beta-1,3-glucanase family protein [Candidatus Tumulicola sp.]
MSLHSLRFAVFLLTIGGVIIACSGGRDAITPDASSNSHVGAPKVKPDKTCPTPYTGNGVSLVVINNSGLPTNDINFLFTATNPNNPTQFEYLNANGSMTVFDSGNQATDLPLSKCFPGSVKSGNGTRLIVPILSGGRLWIALNDKLELSGVSGGGFIQPTGWTKGGPGYNVPWDFIEVSSNNPGIFVDITRVDMLGLPLNLEVLPTSKSSPWTKVGEKLSDYTAMLTQFAGDAPYNKLVTTVPKFTPHVPRIVNPSHDSAFPDVFNATKYYNGGYMNAVLDYYHGTNGITYSTSYKGLYCPGTWTASADDTDFIFTNGSSQQIMYPASLYSTLYILEDNPGLQYGPGTCQYLLDKILLQELNRGVAMTQSHPVTDTGAFYPKNQIDNQYACILHNYSLHNATYAFAFDDADSQASAYSNTAPNKIELTIGPIPSTLPTAKPSPKPCKANY